MGINLPYTAHLATDLAGLGFPPGIVTEHDQAIGNWMTRTYRCNGVQVKVNEQDGEVTVARLADGASSDPAAADNGYDIAWDVDFPRHADPEAILAVVRSLHTLRRLADNNHPMPARRTITPAPAVPVLETDPAAMDMDREYAPVLAALYDTGITAALRSHGHDRWDIRVTIRDGHDITIDNNGRYLPPTLAQVTGWAITRWSGPYLQDRQDIPAGNLRTLAFRVTDQIVAAAA